MKRLLLPLLAAFALVGCQSSEEKDISDCIKAQEEFGFLAPNDMRALCECNFEKYNNQDGSLSMFEVALSCAKEIIK